MVALDLAEYGTEDRLARSLFEHPDVVAWRAGKTGEFCVVLDSLDECKERVTHVATVLGAELARWPTDRLYLRICSRTADWPESLQPQLTGLFRDVHVFELLPLRRVDVEALASSAGIDGHAFVSAIRLARVGPFAAKPLTLGMLLTIYGREGRLPDDVADLYEKALLVLAEEPNAGRRDAGLTGELSAADRIALASRIAAVLTFGNRAAVWTGLASECPETDFTVSDFVGGGEVGTISVTDAPIRETLRTGLFTSRGANRIGWAHQSFAEYLTARFLTAHRLVRKQIRDLLVAPDGHVYPQLRPVAAWLMALRPDEFDWLAQDDPELLLGVPVDVPRPTVRKQAVESLLVRAAGGNYGHRFGQRFAGLAYDGLDSDIRPHVLTGSADERRLAIDLVRDCGLTDLREQLVQIVLETTEPYRLRVSASYALLALADNVRTAELRRLALAPSGDDDPDDELKGYALRLSWPHAMSTGEVFDALTPPRRRNLHGAYRMFVEHELPHALTQEDVGAALDWLLDIERTHARDDHLDRLADRIVALALDQLDDRAVRARLGELAVLRAEQHEGFFIDTFSHDPKPELRSDQRHLLLEAVLPLVTPDSAIALLDHTQYGPRLVTRDDLEWLVARFDSASTERETVAHLIQWVFHPDIPGHVELALGLSDDHNLLAGALRHWFEPVDLESEAACRSRERWRMVHSDDENATIEPPPADDDVERRIVKWLDEFDAGDVDAFWQACVLLYLRPGASHVRRGDELDPDATAQPRWAVLSPAVRSRIVYAARRYLNVGECNPDAWLGENTLHPPAYAGYRAFVLLLRFDNTELPNLPDAVWRRWAAIMVAVPTGFGAGRWDDKATLLQLARNAAPDELFSSAVRLVETRSARDEHIGLEPELAAIWSARLATWLRDSVAQRRFTGRAMSDAMALLAKHDPATARPLLHDILVSHGDIALRAWSGALLLAYDAPESWPTLIAMLRNHPELGEEIVYSHLGAAGRENPPQLGDQELAGLYLWLLERFPFDSDPQFDDVHMVGPREQVADWRDRILLTLQSRGTPNGVAAIKVIERALAQHSWLRAVRRDAELQARVNSWAPIDPHDLLALAAQADARLVSTPAQLLDVVVDALMTIQSRLTGETPESHLLWDTRGIIRPKHEDDISDYLMNRLRDVLGGRGIVVNREVQVRRTARGIGQRTDLRVDAITEGDGSILTLVIEVKGAWHPQLFNAMRTQLVDCYMHDLDITHGVYLVAWSDVESWQGDDAGRKVVSARPREATVATLERQTADLAEEGVTVVVANLDISFARPRTTTAK